MSLAGSHELVTQMSSHHGGSLSVGVGSLNAAEFVKSKAGSVVVELALTRGLISIVPVSTSRTRDSR